MPNAKTAVLLSAAMAVLVSSWATAPAAAQDEYAGGGYIIYDEQTVPGEEVLIPSTDMAQNPNRMDVKAIGMGRTQVANGHRFNAMMDNPALLARKRFAIDLLGVQAGIPKSTVDAAKFVKDNQSQFTSGTFYNEIRDGYDQYQNAATAQERLDGIAAIRQGLVFPNQLLDETIGHQDDPNTHGVNVVPNMQIQWGRWGASLYGTGQIGFQVSPGNSIDQLLSVDIPADAQELTSTTMRTLSNVVSSLFDADGNLSSDGLPQVFAITYADVVGAVGYARPVRPGLDVGANLKVIHRRFSTKNIDSNNVDDILGEARADLDRSITGVTVDLGALYRYAPTGTEFGVALQNVIPVKKIESTARFTFLDATDYYVTDSNGDVAVGLLDENGDYYPYAAGDTLLYTENQQLNVYAPFRLKAPFLLNLGVCHPVNSNLDVSADWVDVFKQDDKYESYISRFRAGTEYRLLHSLVALRGGVADKHLALGAGLNIKMLQLDGAYAYDNFVGDNTYYVQLKLGW